jgi:hypothetical protein
MSSDIIDQLTNVSKSHNMTVEQWVCKFGIDKDIRDETLRRIIKYKIGLYTEDEVIEVLRSLS